PGPRRKNLFRRSRGFTFLEILLALSLVSVLAGSLYATYASGIQIHKRAQKLEQWSRSAFWSFDAMALDLENMLPYHSPAGAASVPDDFFEGTSSGLKLLCSTEEGMKEVRYFLKDADYGTVHKVIVGSRSRAVNAPITIEMSEHSRVQFLAREERAFPAEGGQSEMPLGEGLEILNRYVLKDSLKFSFAETTRAAAWGDIQWETAWKKPALPSLVRIEMTLVNPQAPEETVNLQKDVFIPAGAWR
ncbi:MAG: prepilin-type N-terminal cleavage/methylation domain-containing protein, partial [Candidatus Omnitrophota bacterium]